MKRVKQLKGYWREWIILVSMILLAYTALLRAGCMYKDDLGRALEGYTRWAKSSRYLSDMLAVVLNAGRNLCNTAPLGQILAAVIMAAAGLILSVTFSGTGRPTFFQLAAASVLAVNPYFAECMAFQFDAPLMAVSVFASVFPIWYADVYADSLPDGSHSRKRQSDRAQFFRFGGLIVVCMLVMLTTYQASSGIFPVLTVFWAFHRWAGKKITPSQAVRVSLTSAFFYGLSLAVFKFLLMHNSAGYNEGNMLALRTLPGALAENYRILFRRFRYDMTPVWKILLLLILVCYCVIMLYRTKRRRSVSAACLIAVLAMSAVFAFGIMVMLETAYTRCRVMYGIFVVPVIMLLTAADGKRAYTGKTLSLICLWAFMVFTFTFGNALAMQTKHIEKKCETAAADIARLQLFSDGDVTFRLDGNMGYAPNVSHAAQVYPVIKRLIPDPEGSYKWNRYYFQYYCGLDRLVYDKKDRLTAENLPLVMRSDFYEIYADEANLLVVMKP